MEQECMHRPVIRDGVTVCEDCGETLYYGAAKCPRCGGELHEREAMNSLSRVDNTTRICTGCGNLEAIYNHFWPDRDIPPVDQSLQPFVG